MKCAECGSEIDPGSKKKIFHACHLQHRREYDRARYKRIKESILALQREYRATIHKELGLHKMSGRCQVCGIKVPKNSPYMTYCSRKCYRAAFRNYPPYFGAKQDEKGAGER